MKKLLLVLPFLLLFGCNISEDCIKNSGAMRTKVLPAAAPFDKIYVYPNISVVINESDEYAISVKAGGNVIDDISATVVNGTLELRDNSGCNLNRQYGGKTVYVTVPDIPQLEIYSNTAQTIRGEGQLSIPIFRLFSMDYFGGVGTGDFIFDDLVCSVVDIQSNNVSIFRLKGTADQMNLYFYDDLSRFEGKDFEVGQIDIFQRSANDMIIHPLDQLTGNIYSTGNVICKTQPPMVDVVRHYSGRLIYD